MDLDKCLHEKRGCKQYLPKKIPTDVLGELLEAGICAPSAGNLQNWSFIVVTDKEKKEAVAVAALNQRWVQDAPVLIVVCDHVKKITDLYPTRGKLYATQACAIAAQNTMLKATDLGLHCCWVGAFNEEGIRRALQIPEDVVPEMIITLGYSKDHREEELQRDACDKVTFFNEYGKKTTDAGLFPLKKRLSAFEATMQQHLQRREVQQGFLSKLKSIFKKH